MTRTLLFPTPNADILSGQSPQILELRQALDRLAEAPQRAVLIAGEPGAGKETTARALHARTSPDAEFVHVLDREGAHRLLALEAPAGVGTLFLGELCELSSSLQARLLRFLRVSAALGSSAPHVRLVASSSRNVDRAVRDRALRPDLAYRFAARLVVPPLRERPQDVPSLCDAILARLGCTRAPSTAALERLSAHDWPGNVRELVNLLEQAVHAAGGEQIGVEQLPLPAVQRSVVNYRLPADGVSFDELEREVIGQALRLAAGNQTRAASLLGLTRDQIRYRMAKFGMRGEVEVKSRVA
jgi:DNA-binding NtrC family response regulator